MDQTPVDVSVVIPTYRSGGALLELVPRIVRVLHDRGVVFEVVVVDDRSPDGNWLDVQQLAKQHPEVVGIRLQKNVGQMAATQCGLAVSRGEIAITMDDDLQHLPEEVPNLLEALDENHDWDVVIGAWDRGNDSWFRSIGSRVFTYLQDSAIDAGRGLRHTGFRAMRRNVVAGIVQHETRHPVMSSLPLEVASSIHNVEVAHAERVHGESNFNLGASIRLTVTNFVQSSTAPLRALMWFGILVAVSSALVGATYLLRTALGTSTPPGWASTFLPILFFGGATLMAVGLLGRYIEVIMQEVRRPPRWVVRETTDD